MLASSKRVSIYNDMLRLLSLALISFVGVAGADLMPPDQDQKLAREIYKEMIESPSGFSTGPTTPIAKAWRHV